jgi:hypothetical protein
MCPNPLIRRYTLLEGALSGDRIPMAWGRDCLDSTAYTEYS